jgi:hypothetical protein
VAAGAATGVALAQAVKTMPATSKTKTDTNKLFRIFRLLIIFIYSQILTNGN